MIVDSHCHLEYKGLVEDQQGVLARARESGNRRFSEYFDPAERVGTGSRHCIA